jgi:hypothetical protein
MPYVSRRILTTNSAGESIEVDEAEFASGIGPRILLGEPGSGKSDTATEIARLFGGHVIHAELLTSNAPILLNGGKLLIVDGVDEITSNGNIDPVSTILNRLLSEKIETFMMTCRAADWRHATSEDKITRRFKTAPLVGQLLSLNDDELSAMVEGITNGATDGANFVKQAGQHSAMEFARNPQSLLMLLKAIAENGWPRTKLELYESACKQLSHDHSAVHASLDPNRPATDRILEAAGFVSAQLLLSGKRGIATDGQSDPFFPRPVELYGDHVIDKEVQAAIGSRLMRVSSARSVEPCHRTVAEYLAARWLAKAVTGHISIRRLESMIYASGTTTVPTSLRGVHAWFAVLAKPHTHYLLAADPYGILRYGDASALSDAEIKLLLRELLNLSRRDPFFRSEDWNSNLGKALARDAAEVEILALIKDKDVSYQLKTMMLENIKGTAMAKRIRTHLNALVFEETASYVERLRATEAMLEDVPDSVIVSTVRALASKKTVSATRLAVEVVGKRPSALSGKEIGKALIAHNLSKGSNRISGIGYRLIEALSPEQLVDLLNQLTIELRKHTTTDTDKSREIEEKVVEAIEFYLRKGRKPTAKKLWEWLAPTHGRSYRDQKWKIFSNEYFEANPDARIQVQALALAKDDAWKVGSELNRKAAGLGFHEDDLVVHMDALLALNRKPKDWVNKWFYLFRWAEANTSYSGKTVAHAHEQAKLFPELKYVLDTYKNQPEPQWAIDHRSFEQERLLKRQAELDKRKLEYSNIRKEMAEGVHLGALNDITSAYFGWFSDLDKEGNPNERIAELVGEENVLAAIAGLRAVRSRQDFPTVREATELRANQNKEYFIQRIAIASCALQVAEGGNLADLSEAIVMSALEGLKWGLYGHGEGVLQELEASLQTLIFADPVKREQFIRDTIEPMLEAKQNGVSGLYSVTNEARFADIVGKLSLDWLKLFPDMLPDSLGYVLDAAVARSSHDEFLALIETRLIDNNWTSVEHRILWHRAAFVMGFTKFKRFLEPFGRESRDRLWPFTHAFWKADVEVSELSSDIIDRLVYILETFANAYPAVEIPEVGWGGNSGYEGAQFIARTITRLSSITSTAAHFELKRLAADNKLGNHLDHAKHVLAEQERQLAELSWGRRTLEDVRSVLQGGKPGTIDDLQNLVMDELAVLQRHLQDGITEGIEPYWNDRIPHGENYCRNRIVDGLQNRLERYQVRAHTEGTMPDNNRCDILCTCDAMDLPIEIKCQWHNEVWNAASTQLEDNYTREYRADGRGIYLVIWFGHISGKNTPGITGKPKPESASDVLRLIPEVAPRPISGLTKLLVLDVSRPTVLKNKKTRVRPKKASAAKNPLSRKKVTYKAAGNKFPKITKNKPLAKGKTPRKTINHG